FFGCYAANKARSQLVFLNVDDFKHAMGLRRGKTRHAGVFNLSKRPFLAAGKATGKNPYIVSVARNGQRIDKKIAERAGRSKRCYDPMLPFLNDAEGCNVNLTCPIGGCQDRLANIGHQSSSPVWLVVFAFVPFPALRSVWPAS